MLTKGETIEDFREVTPKEREALEKADAAWQEPPQLFIDLWNEACGVWGGWNAETGYFELNGLTDITYEQALETMKAKFPIKDNAYRSMLRIRTNMPFNRSSILSSTDAFNYSHKIEAANLENQVFGARTFYGCSKLKRIVNAYGINFETSMNDCYFHCYSLEDIDFKAVYSKDFSLADSPLLNIETFKRLSKSSKLHTNTVTITVHPDVYAKLTDEENTEWHQVLLDAAEKNITFITV